MKQQTRPTRWQKVEIERNGLNARNWLVERDVPTELVLVHRNTGNVRRIMRAG